jgi:hypothetical protein
VIALGKTNTPFNDNFNISPTNLYTGFYFQDGFYSGNLNCWLNGLVMPDSGFSQSQNFLWNNDFGGTDELIVDFISGNKSFYTGSPYSVSYTGQEIYLNGVMLLSGVDFSMVSNTLIVTGKNTGVSGVISTIPIRSSFVTGSGYLFTGKLQKNSSRLFLNGVRQKLGNDYIEGSKFDLLTGNNYNEYNNISFYDSDGTFWE